MTLAVAVAAVSATPDGTLSTPLMGPPTPSIVTTSLCGPELSLEEKTSAR